MQRLILITLCIAASLTEVKDASAQETYGLPSDYGNLGYNQPTSYGQGYGNAPPPYGAHVGYEYFRPPQPPLIDRDICDLDASVLLVVSSRRYREHRHRHHDGKPLNRAHRVRCSVIANYDENSCNTCCQHAARRDKNLKNNQFIGFLAVTNEFERWKDEDRYNDRDRDDHLDDDGNLEDDEHMRFKRSHDDKPNKLESLNVPEKDFMPAPYYNNVKCVCCAPKRPLPPPTAQAPPMYQQPSSHQSNYQQSQASPSYPSPPAASQPSYQSDSQQSQALQSYPSHPPASQPEQSQPTYGAAPALSPIQSSYQAAAPPVSTQPLYKSAQDPGPY